MSERKRHTGQYGRFILPSLPSPEYAALKTLCHDLDASQWETLCAAIRVACDHRDALHAALLAFRSQAPSETPPLIVAPWSIPMVRVTSDAAE